jgi:hypothetical protein
VASDAEWAAAAAEARGLMAASSRIVRALDHVPGQVVPQRREAPGRRWWIARVAALLVIVAGTAIVWRRETVPVSIDSAVAPQVVAAKPQAAAPPLTDRVATPPKRGAAVMPGTQPKAPTNQAIATAPPAPSAASPEKVTAPRDSSFRREQALGAAAAMTEGAMRAGARAAVEPTRVSCYRISGPLGADIALAQAKVASRTLALTDVVAAGRAGAMEARAAAPAERMAVRADAQRPLQGEIQGNRADTVIVTWRDGAQAFRVRAVARGDSLIEVRNAEADSVAGLFRAVRVSCP